jgi:hypothetical protein
VVETGSGDGRGAGEIWPVGLGPDCGGLGRFKSGWAILFNEAGPVSVIQLTLQLLK